MRHMITQKRRSAVLCCLAAWLVPGSGAPAQDGKSRFSTEVELATGERLEIDETAGGIHFDSLLVEAESRRNGHRLSVELAGRYPDGNDRMVEAKVRFVDADGSIVSHGRTRRVVEDGKKTRTVEIHVDSPSDLRSRISTVQLDVETQDAEARNDFSGELDFALGQDMELDAVVGRVELEALAAEAKPHGSGYSVSLRLFGRNPHGHDQMVVATARLLAEDGSVVAVAEGKRMISEEGKKKAVKMRADVPGDPSAIVSTIALEIATWDE